MYRHMKEGLLDLAVRTTERSFWAPSVRAVKVARRMERWKAMIMQKRERRRPPYQAARTTQCARVDWDHWIEPVTAEATMVPWEGVSGRRGFREVVGV